MRGRTFALSQKELQRVSVISSCVKGDTACTRAAELLALSVRQVRRLAASRENVCGSRKGSSAANRGAPVIYQDVVAGGAARQMGGA
jgi:hypothetical protein